MYRGAAWGGAAKLEFGLTWRTSLRVQRCFATPFLYAVDLSCVLGFVNFDYWFIGLIFYLMICTEWEQLPAPWLQEVPAVAQAVARSLQLHGCEDLQAVARQVASGCEDLCGRDCEDAVARTIVGISSRRWLWQFRRAMWSCQLVAPRLRRIAFSAV